MKLYKFKQFSKWARSERLKDNKLCDAIDEMGRGLFEAELGNGLYKKRISRPGQGKRGGYRTLVAFKNEERAIFLFGFAKNERANIGDDQLALLKQLAKQYLAMQNKDIAKLIKSGLLIEVGKNGKEK